jgi:hypothetical protein
MMIKNCLFAVALLSLAICAGCSGNGKNGNGAARVAVSPTAPTVGLTLPQQFIADVTGVDNHSVTWKITQSGAACSPGCGSISAGGLYTAPAALQNPGNPFNVTVTATSVANDGASDSATAKVVPITVLISPGASNFPVVVGVTQQFTATAFPDAAPQTVTWSLEQSGAACSPACGTIDANGLYTAPAVAPNPTAVSVIATSTVASNPVSSTMENITIVSSRLSGSSTYAFRVSGFDSGGSFAATAGNFVTNASGTAIVGGVEDELTASQAVHRSITGGSLSLDANDHGTLTMTTGAGTRTFKVAFAQGGDGQFIEFDSHARGTGVFVKADPTKFKNSTLKTGSSFVFGSTGIDTTAKRTGYVGLFKPDGAGGITSGLIDINDNTVAKSDTNVTGTYNIVQSGNPDAGGGTLTLSTDVGTFNFALYVVSGATTNANNPLTLYVISTDDPQTAPAEIGTIVFQDPALAGTNADLNASALTNLTGVDSTGSKTLASLTAAGGDGNGHIGGTYDANNAGTIVAAKSFSGYAYACAAGGRCTVDLLGDPAANPVVPPVHFVLYLSATNRGFLLDQSSQAVMTGTMDPQKIGGFFAPSELAGPFAAATTTSGTPGVSQVEANLLLTSPGNGVFNVGGSQDETDAGGQNAAQVLTGIYDIDAGGAGTIKLTAPATANYVIYAVDNPANQNNLVQHFYILNVDPANASSSIIFAER